MGFLAARYQSLTRLFRQEIWQSPHLKDRSPRGRLYACLRVVSITSNGLEENNAFSRAAALTFSSLLGLGPLVAIAVLVAGFVLDQNDPHLAANSLNKLLRFVAPTIALHEEAPPGAPKSDIVTAATLHAPAPEAAPVNSASVELDPEILSLIDGFIDGSRNGAVGAIGALTLIFIVLQLFTSIESAFNEIWGVHRGRSWFARIAFYWTILTLGAVLFFAAVTGLSAGAFFNTFAAKIPLGPELLELLRFLVPSLSIVMLVGILTLFYRYIPNTHVLWRAAFIGAVVVALLLVLNNFLAFLYFRRVILARSLYGSLGILPILMIGLYVFWFFVLLGGQVSYAVQNARFRNSQAAWNGLAESTREQLSLVVLLTICRRFNDCLPPCTAAQLGEMLKVPTQLLNESINRLKTMGLVTSIPPQPTENATDYRFQPGRPLSRITLGDFKHLDDNLGTDPNSPVFSDFDPVLSRYIEETGSLTRSAFFQQDLESLFREHKFDDSRPPFTFGARRPAAGN